MIMKHLFCEPTASLEEFAEKRKKMNRLFSGMTLLGLFTILFLLLILPRYVTISGAKMDFFSGFYTGVGIALMLCGVILRVRNEKMLANPEAMKRARCEAEDERNREITMRAARSAAFAMIIVAYVVMLVAGAFSTAVFLMCMAMILLFAVLLLIFLAYYRHKM